MANIFLFEKKLLVLAAVLLAVSACSSGRQLRTVEASGPAGNRPVTLVLFGCRYSADLLNVAFLDAEGDRLTFGIYAPDFNYRVERGIPLQTALKRAREFVQCNLSFDRSETRRIMDEDGQAIGYEVRALYSPFRFGMADVMDIQYRLKANTVAVNVRLDPRVESEVNNHGGDWEREKR